MKLPQTLKTAAIALSVVAATEPLRSLAHEGEPNASEASALAALTYPEDRIETTEETPREQTRLAALETYATRPSQQQPLGDAELTRIVDRVADALAKRSETRASARRARAADPESLAEQHRSAEATRVQHASAYDRRLEAEAASPEFEAELHFALSTGAGDPEIRVPELYEARCSVSLCRLVFARTDGEDGLEAAIDTLAMTAPAGTVISFAPALDGEELVAHMVRPIDPHQGDVR